MTQNQFFFLKKMAHITSELYLKRCTHKKGNGKKIYSSNEIKDSNSKCRIHDKN